MVIQNLPRGTNFVHATHPERGREAYSLQVGHWSGGVA